MKLRLLPCIFLVCICISGCSKIQKVTDIVTQPTSRELYEREFDANDSLYIRWKSKSEIVKYNGLSVPLPFGLSGKFIPKSLNALSYKLKLQQGEIFEVSLEAQADSTRLFIDVFNYKNDSILSNKPLFSNDFEKSRFQFNVKKTGFYQIVIQPEIEANTTFNLSMYTQPTLEFPVAGKSNSAIQSFWGASRDGGSRSHQGVDIFASRGTPVVAITDGFISSVGERGLGGKQVWLRNGVFGYSLYYAHLDSIAVISRKRIKRGDTLGFVGNTGNAKTTNPHLHFGIYTSQGAIDPLPFIKLQDIPIVNASVYTSIGITRLQKNELRMGPRISYEKITNLHQKDTLTILGKHEQWYHVKSADTLEGFMHESLLFLK